MRQLSDYFRPPPHNAVVLIRNDSGALNTRTTRMRGSNDILSLTDTINSSVLATQQATFPGPAFHLAFIRGGVIQNRLQVESFQWTSIREIFSLDLIVEELELVYGRATVAGILQEIRRKTIMELLRHNDTSGPTKLLTRLRIPDEEMWSCTDYRQIENLMDQMAELGCDCDDLTRSILAEPGPRDSLYAAQPDLVRWLDRCDMESHTANILEHFGEFLECQESESCLHPCLPFEPAALQRTATLLSVPPAVAKKLIYLFRFAWITSLSASAKLSDLSFKFLCVYPRTATNAPANPGGPLHQKMSDKLQNIVATHPDLQAFQLNYPGVSVETTLFSLGLPESVYKIFVADTSIDARLRYLVMSHLGGAYLEEFVSERAKNIPGIWLPETGWIENVNSFRVKSTFAGDGHIDRKTLPSRNLSPSHVKLLLTKAIEDDSGHYLNKCQALFNRVGRRDLVGNLRGAWSLSDGCGNSSIRKT